MNKTTRRMTLAGSVAVGLFAAAFFAHAGASDTPAVTFTGCPASTVSGDIRAFRNNTASGASYFAHCSLIANSAPLSLTASCSVGNYNPANPGHATGTCPNKRFTCTSTDAAIIDAVTTLQSNSKLTVSVSNASTCASGGACTCTSIQVDNFSNDGVLTIGD
jgi:hypothetical protein